MKRFEDWFTKELPKTKIIVDQLVSSNSVEVKTKADQSLVTTVDLQLSEWLITELNRNFPDYIIVSEEDTPTQIKVDKVIFIDPIDETSTFCAGGQDYAVLVGVVENNTPVAGAVFYPARNILWYATPGRQQLMPQLRPVVHNTITALTKRKSALDHTKLSLPAPLQWTAQYNNCRSVERVLQGDTRGHLYIWSGGAWDIAAWHALASYNNIKVIHSDGSKLEYNSANPMAISAVPVLFLGYE